MHSHRLSFVMGVVCFGKNALFCSQTVWFCTKPYKAAWDLLRFRAIQRRTDIGGLVELPINESLQVSRKALRKSIHRIRRTTMQTKTLLRNSSSRVSDDHSENSKRIVNKPQ